MKINQPDAKRNRHLSRSQAAALVNMWMVGGQDWIHMATSLPQTQRAREYQRLRHWGLVEKAEGQRPDGNPSRGYWRLTDKGVQFMMTRITVKETLVEVRHDGKWSVGWFTGDDITISDALGTEFNYDEIRAYR